MSNPDVDEDAIDTEALQAQIDLSMSFAQNLVSSWVKPNGASTSSRKKNLETELKEYMRRPARLGVGAPIPETQNLSRETARLKGQISGPNSNKRSRGEAADSKKADTSDEEQESRAGAIKKKAKVDPFEGVHGKKKKKKTEEEKQSLVVASTATVAEVSLVTRTTSEDAMAADESLLTEMKDSETHAPNISSKSKKMMKRETLRLLASPSHAKPDAYAEISGRNIAPASPPRSEISKPEEDNSRLHVDVLRSPEPASKPKITLTAALLSSITPRKSLPAALLNQPILNLDGSASDDGSGDEVHGDKPVGSPKKKRKRRKKKRHSSA